MIHVNFDPDALTTAQKAEWDLWIKNAEARTKEVIKSYEDWRAGGSIGEFKVKLDATIWTDLKNFLIKNVFRGKCAYCETRSVRWPHHAEHFRPKGRVKMRDKVSKKLVSQKTIDEEGKEIDHPGYFWLAYDWKNLVPSCNDCNTARGKKDQFPIKNKPHKFVVRLSPAEFDALKEKPIPSEQRSGVYYLQSETLDELEIPLLLHPYRHNPADYLVFGEFGVVTAIDDNEIGKEMIEVCELDNDRLRVARQMVQEMAVKEYGEELVHGRNRSLADRRSKARLAVKAYIDGDEQYSAAALDCLRIYYTSFE